MCVLKIKKGFRLKILKLKPVMNHNFGLNHPYLFTVDFTNLAQFTTEFNTTTPSPFDVYF